MCRVPLRKGADGEILTLMNDEGGTMRRDHDTTRAARDDLGSRGITMTGHAYAWCEREGLYHVTPTFDRVGDRVTRYMVCERPNGATRKGSHANMPLAMSNAQRRRGTRRITVNTTWLRVILAGRDTVTAHVIAEGAGL